MPILHSRTVVNPSNFLLRAIDRRMAAIRRLMMVRLIRNLEWIGLTI
jgi:hypothetical protein